MASRKMSACQDQWQLLLGTFFELPGNGLRVASLKMDLCRKKRWRNFHVRHQGLEGSGLCSFFCALQFQQFSTISEVLLVLCFMVGAGSWLWLIRHQEQIDSPGESPKALIHPRRLTWNIVIEVWKIIFLSKWVICRFHVNLPGCMRLLIFNLVFSGSRLCRGIL